MLRARAVSYYNELPVQYSRQLSRGHFMSNNLQKWGVHGIEVFSWFRLSGSEVWRRISVFSGILVTWRVSWSYFAAILFCPHFVADPSWCDNLDIGVVLWDGVIASCSAHQHCLPFVPASRSQKRLSFPPSLWQPTPKWLGDTTAMRGISVPFSPSMNRALCATSSRTVMGSVGTYIIKEYVAGRVSGNACHVVY